jgi:hypothetical protein
MTTYFDYKVFYSYYSNINNFYLNNIPITVKFYERNKESTAILSGQYFIFDNINIYVTLIGNNEILFTIIRPDSNNVYWADHFHIGKIIFNNVVRGNKNVDTVFLHYSFQDNKNGIKDMSRKCNFRNNMEDLDNIPNILCTNKGSTMNIQFVDFIDLITHILQRPYKGPHIGGSKYNIKQLKEIAKKHNIKLKSSMRKNEIISTLKSVLEFYK